MFPQLFLHTYPKTPDLHAPSGRHTQLSWGISSLFISFPKVTGIAVIWCPPSSPLHPPSAPTSLTPPEVGPLILFIHPPAFPGAKSQAPQKFREHPSSLFLGELRMAPYLPAWSLPLCLSGPLPACPPALLLGSGLAKGGGGQSRTISCQETPPSGGQGGKQPYLSVPAALQAGGLGPRRHRNCCSSHPSALHASQVTTPSWPPGEVPHSDLGVSEHSRDPVKNQNVEVLRLEK